LKWTLATRGFTRPALRDSVSAMSTITAILEADADGTLHLPLPVELRHGKIEVTATLKPANGASSTLSPPASLKGFGCLNGKISMSPDFDEPLEDFKDYTG
jgi:hypothetical protein